MSETYFDGKTPPVPCDDNDVKKAAEAAIPEFREAMDRYAFQRALDAAWKLLVAINAYIVSREPWKHFKEKGADEALSRILWNVLEGIAHRLDDAGSVHAVARSRGASKTRRGGCALDGGARVGGSAE
jgi:methionyl-tRNA synthetase